VGERILAAIICLVVVTSCDSDDATDAATDTDQTNEPPEIVTDPPTSLARYETLTYDVECRDPESAEVTLAVDDDDTCGGELADVVAGTATYSFVAEFPPEESCTLALSCTDGEHVVTQSAEVTAGPAADVLDLDFVELEHWAEPIADYIEMCDGHPRGDVLMRGIHDLAVFGPRLYLGFGDANLNIGREFTIDLRYWERPDPEGVHPGFATDEEQVSLFRPFEDLLVVPGVDATEDGLLGNVYTSGPDGEWYKSRTLDLAWHVHDASVLGDTVYACGSGGTLDDYENSTVNGLLFRSTDGGVTFESLVVHPHPDPPGDNRFTNLLAVGGELFIMGYFSAGETTYAQAYRLVGSEIEPWSELRDLFVTQSASLSEDLGLLVGVNIGSPLTWGFRLVTDTAVVWPETFYGDTVIDVQPLGDGRAVVLAAEGDAYERAPGPWEVFVAVLDEAGEEEAVLLRQTFETQPLSIAFWRRDLYLGMPDGSVWRAAGR
jgi:hypothetical protein